MPSGCKARFRKWQKSVQPANGGVQRLALSDEDKQARDLFVKWLGQIDLEVRIDEMGNIFGWRKRTNNELPPVMSGSHIDSQPKGGRFDGILGVLGALEVLRTLQENKVAIKRPMTVVVWTNEEGTRFSPATWWPPWGKFRTNPIPETSYRTRFILPWISAPGMMS